MVVFWREGGWFPLGWSKMKLESILRYLQKCPGKVKEEVLKSLCWCWSVHWFPLISPHHDYQLEAGPAVVGDWSFGTHLFQLTQPSKGWWLNQYHGLTKWTMDPLIAVPVPHGSFSAQTLLTKESRSFHHSCQSDPLHEWCFSSLIECLTASRVTLSDAQ